MKNRLLRNSLVLTAGSLLGALSGFMFNALVAQTYGPDRFGRFSLALMTVSIIGAIAVLGLPEGIVTFVSRYQSEDDESNTVGIILISIIICGITSVIGVLLIYALAPFIAVRIFDDPQLIEVLQVIIFALPALVLIRITSAVAMGYERGEYSVLIKQIGQRGILFGLTATFVILQLGFEWVITAYVLSAWAAVVIGVIVLVSLVRTWPNNIGLPFVPIVSFSLPLLFSNITGIISNWIDTFLVGVYISSSAVGIYQAAFLLGANILIVNSAVSLSFFPEVSSLFESEDRQKATERYQSAVKWTVIVTFAPGIYLIAFPTISLRTIFGSGFSTGALALIIITLGNLGAALTGPATEVIKADGYTKFIFVTTAVGLVANVMINVLTIPLIGIIGAAIGTAATTLITNGSHLFAMKRWCSVKPALSSLWFVPIIGIVSVGPSFLTLRYVDSVPSFLMHIIFFSVLYMTGLILTGAITQDDLQQVVARFK